MNFDVLSFIFGKLNCGSNFNDVVSYLLGKAVSAVWKTIRNVAIASFTAVASPLKEFIVDITPIQSGSGDPSPSNIRHISGWTGANILRAVKSIVPVDYAEISRTNFDITVTKKTIRKDWLAQGNNYYFLAQIADSFTGYDNLPAGLYSFKGTFTSNSTLATNGVYARFANTAGTEWVDAILNGDPVQVDEGWALNTIYAEVAGQQQWQANDWAQLEDFAIGIEPTTFSVSWQTEAGTVYGGTLTDNGDGTWTLVKTMESVDLGTLEWTYNNLFCASLADAKKPSSNAYPPSAICERYAPLAVNEYDTENNVFMVSQQRQLWINDTTYGTDAGAFKTAMNGVKLVYELATPASSVTLTAESVKTLLGANNIFADCGNINTITYRER